MKKKLLFVIPYLYEGGAQRALSNIQMNFPDDWEIETLVNSEYKKAFPFRGKIHSLGITEKPKTGSVLFQFRVFVLRILKLRKLKKSGNYAACISFSDSASVANILSGNKYCKTIVSVRVSLSGSRDLPQYRYIVNPLARLMYGRADKVVAVSKELEKELVTDFKLDKKKVVAIPNGYDLEKIKKLADEAIEPEVLNRITGKKIICNVGRLSPQKGQGHLIRAFQKVHDNIPDSVLLIAGEGPQEQYLNDLIKQLDLNDCVIMLGHTENVYKYLNKSDLFVFPSLFEGFPNALAEAMCVGLPCIASDFRTGAREIIAPDIMDKTEPVTKAIDCEYGILTPVCSGTEHSSYIPLESTESELSDAMIRVLTDKELSNQLEGKSVERSKILDIRNAIHKWIQVIYGE
ncbi:glycosyltransferase [Butyrivibrio sp. AE2032]|uniref:glycosyltransferase n=1 Tax=Butyrivibrio sp. AE2032 TaxID=1458463 RepID=UPI0005570E3B|nr:glycosyltransferase [Butyrivibrio sp. AE2032]